MEETFDLREYIRFMYFIDNMEKKIGDVPLIDTDHFSGLSLKIQSQIAKSNMFFTSSRSSFHSYKIYHSEIALSNLETSSSIIKFLSFRNYRLVGEACLNGLYGENNNDPTRPNHLSFSLLIEKIANESINLREIRIRKLYIDFLQEVEGIYNTEISLKDHYSFFIYRNENSTVIILKPLQRPSESAWGEEGVKTIKIELSHQVFENEAQMLHVLDFMPFKVLFDGSIFKCTFAGMMAIKSVILPVDFCSFDVSFAENLYFASHSEIQIVFPGLSPQLLHHNKEAFNFPFGLELRRFESLGLLDFNHRNYRAQIKNFEDIPEINVNYFLQKTPIAIRARTVSELISSPEIPEIDSVFISLSDISQDFSRKKFKELFGEHALKAFIAHFEEDEKTYTTFVLLRIEELKAQMIPILESLKIVKFKESIPSIKTHPREVYGNAYNSFVCTAYWEAKQEILCAMKNKGTEREEKNCVLVKMLNRDMIELIFFQLDLIYAKEQKSFYLELCTTPAEDTDELEKIPRWGDYPQDYENEYQSDYDDIGFH